MFTKELSASIFIFIDKEIAYPVRFPRQNKTAQKGIQPDALYFLLS
jgi:hypothetical protein